jgi:hypothetical protein
LRVGRTHTAQPEVNPQYPVILHAEPYPGRATLRPHDRRRDNKLASHIPSDASNTSRPVDRKDARCGIGRHVYPCLERAGRRRLGEDGESVLSRHAQLVCDRVEIFAPVVFERFRPQIEAR